MTAINRRVVLGALAAAGLSATGCFAQKPAELTPAEIVARGSEALGSVKSVHFTLVATNGSMVIGGSLPAKEIEGDIVRPDRIKGTATSTFGNMTVQIGFAVIGSQEFITNPISKQWQAVPGAVAAPNLLDPNKGASALLKQTTGLQKQPDQALNGTDCYHLSASLDGGLIAGLIGAKGLGNTLAGEIWLAKSDFLIRQIKLAGPITADEPPKIERVLTLSNYNESIAIEPPV